MTANFFDSPYFHVYVQELWLLSRSIGRKCERVFAECPETIRDQYIKVDPDLHGTIASILAEAANVKKLLTVPTKAGFREEHDAFEFRKQRAAMLNEALSAPELKEIFKVDARNSVEHFDQYLDRASLKLPGSPSGWAFYNGVFSSWNVFSERVYPLKLYVADERKYYNLEMESDLGRIHEESRDLVSRIEALVGEKQAKEGPGGMMLPIGAA